MGLFPAHQEKLFPSPVADPSLGRIAILGKAFPTRHAMMSRPWQDNRGYDFS
jgi:hypothetical protein